MGRTLPIALALLGMHLLWPASASAEGLTDEVTDERLAVAVESAVDFLWSQQGRDGRWVSDEFEEAFPGGLTALAAFTLRSAGTPVSNSQLRLAAHKLKNREDMLTTYARSFSLMLWCALDPERYRREIAADIRFLTAHQHAEGGWGYGLRTGTTPRKDWQDHSNSQLALLALWEATQAGAEVSKGVWRKAEKCWLSTQNEDGGWGYPIVDDPDVVSQPRDSYGSMTAAGFASLHLIYDQLYAEAELPFNGRFKAYCGRDIPKTRPIRQAIERANTWLVENYRVDQVPGLLPGPTGDFRKAWWTYYLYSLDRVGVASGFKRITGREWYRDIAGQLIARQQPDGSWGNVYQTCFGVLALLKARTPVLVNKLEFGEPTDWNRDPRDAANLTRWFSLRFETQQTWQVIDLKDHPEDLRDAPVLYITGHEAPRLDQAQREKLRDFVWSGGTILAVACCSKEEFVNGMIKALSEMFPRLEPTPLSADHPMWSLHAPVEPGTDVIGLSDGDRTAVFVLANGACCVWHQNASERYARLFHLGSNILRYATYGRPLRGRLTPYWPHEPPEPLGTLAVARLEHGGDFWANPHALKRLSEQMTRHLGLGIDEKPAVDARNARSAGVPLLWLGGHEFTPPEDPGGRELTEYLRSGGTLLASASCGSKAFDDAFVPWAQNLFGADHWETIPADDPIMTGSLPGRLGSTLHALTLRSGLDGTPPARLDWPILYGVRDQGRWILIYSPYDIACGLTDHPCIGCVGYTPEDAVTLTANVLLYVATHQPP